MGKKGLSKQEIKHRLSKLPIKYEILEFNKLNDFSVVKDPEYGIFKTKLKNLFNGYGLHPKRKETEKEYKLKKKLEKTRRTCLKKYGTECVLQNKQIRHKKQN